MTFLRLIWVWMGAASLLNVAPSLIAAESSGLPGDFSARTWGKAQGLMDDSVTAVLQGRDGFLWVGTAAGLARFDGIKFTETPLAQPARPARVTALCEDEERLWIGTQQEGLFCRSNGVVTAMGRAQGLSDLGITSLALDTNHVLWIGTRSGLNRWDGRRLEVFDQSTGLTDPWITGIHVARSGTVWITTRSGMNRLKDGRVQPFEFETDSQGRSPEFLGAYEDRRGNLWGFGDTYLINLTEEKRFNYFRGAEAPSVRIWSLCEGHDGRLWIGTSGRGLFCFDGTRFQPVPMNDGRPPNDVRAIAEDREGNLWLGTASGGLTQLSRRSVALLKLPESSIPTCLAAGANGRVYVALENSGVLLRDAGRFEVVGDPDGLLASERVVALATGGDGTLWAGTDGGGLFGVRDGRAVRFTTANGLSDDFVTAVCADARGTVWVGTRAGAIHRIERGLIKSVDEWSGALSRAVSMLVPSRSGGLWIVLEGGLIYRLPESGPVVSSDRRGGLGRKVTAICEGRGGRLWAATDGEGLVCYFNGTQRTWNSHSGLPDNRVLGVVEDKGGNLWIANQQGLLRVPREAVDAAVDQGTRLVVKPVFDADPSGFGPSPSGSPGGIVASDGAVWFATSQGLLIADTGEWIEEHQPVPVYLEQIQVNGRELPLSGPGYSQKIEGAAGKPLRLSPDLRALDVNFTALSLSAPEKVRFRHKLEGFDTDWIGVGTDRHVHYARLSFGQYRLRIEASVGGGVWNESEAVFSFRVPVPMWRSPGAFVLYGLLAAGSVAGTVRIVSHRRLRRRLAALEQQQAMERERMRIAQDMHDEIGSKLTKLSFLSERARAEVPDSNPLAGKIGSIATTSRDLLQTLDEIVWAVNPRNDSLEHLAVYLGQYASEYFQNTSVECELRLPRQIPHHPLSAETRHNLFLAFEEALNNVLKHSGADRVKVEMSVSNIRFEILVSDNGAGFDLDGVRNDRPHGRGGNGLGNMEERLEKTGGRCVLRSRKGEGTTVILAIPLESPETNRK